MDYVRPALAVLCCAAAALGGCASGPSQADRARTELVGLPPAALKDCAFGQRTTRDLGGGRTLIAVSRGAPTMGRGVTITGDGGGLTIGGSQSIGRSRGGGSEYGQNHCRAMFMVQDGKVERVEFSGEPYRSTPAEQSCSDIVAACLPAR